MAVVARRQVVTGPPGRPTGVSDLIETSPFGENRGYFWERGAKRAPQQKGGAQFGRWPLNRTVPHSCVHAARPTRLWLAPTLCSRC